MAKRLTFFILALLVLISSSIAETRPIPSIMLLESLSPEEMEDGGECNVLGSEECLIRRSMIAHTDYIYTQDITPETEPNSVRTM